MPKEGFKSVTVTDEFHAKWSRKYRKQKKELRSKGVNSFSAFIAYVMNEVDKNDNTR
tara:strand:- start:622 stop:792 length:171 start_codon:yes stop_codon:yes gene_type:complete